jgi:hypothetical protein
MDSCGVLKTPLPNDFANNFGFFPKVYVLKSWSSRWCYCEMVEPLEIVESRGRPWGVIWRELWDPVPILFSSVSWPKR